jgi:hypothetical protein
MLSFKYTLLIAWTSDEIRVPKVASNMENLLEKQAPIDDWSMNQTDAGPWTWIGVPNVVPIQEITPFSNKN